MYPTSASLQFGSCALNAANHPFDEGTTFAGFQVNVHAAFVAVHVGCSMQPSQWPFGIISAVWASDRQHCASTDSAADVIAQAARYVAHDFHLSSLPLKGPAEKRVGGRFSADHRRAWVEGAPEARHERSIQRADALRYVDVEGQTLVKCRRLLFAVKNACAPPPIGPSRGLGGRHGAANRFDIFQVNNHGIAHIEPHSFSSLDSISNKNWETSNRI